MSHETIAGYRVLARIGKGAASDLYAVQDRKTKQVWALKHVVKTSEKDQRFLDQIQQEYTVGPTPWTRRTGKGSSTGI